MQTYFAHLVIATARLAGLLAVAAQGVDTQRFAVGQGRVDTTPPVLPAGALAAAGWALGPAQAEAAQRHVLDALQAFHANHPDELGPDAMRLRRLALPRLAQPLLRALLVSLQATQAVVVQGAVVHLPAHGVQLSALDERIAQAVAPALALALAQAGFVGAWARAMAQSCNEPEPLVRTTLARLAQRGELHQIVRDLYLPPPALLQLAGLARTVAAAHGGDVTAAAFRDATRLGRKRAIQVLEYFDRVGLLRRVGDVHRLRPEAAVFADGVGA